ncbi:hypothetical protein PUR71_36590 [Streptomyces sp. SP17BM10]|uniref:hypothetical protein n=1 Tax=Streptomyces sp. SP17BM10 TaxID=3002530 RepID=UPI002E787EBD|nr:hypothetical protein [Streptomyces sp. SP17BM10]MEE1788378.1 hypothetical protein [Streptomyces sp. SP17BM10]
MRTRTLLAAPALAVAALGLAALPAAAHGDTVHLEIPGQQNGHVTTVATFENDRDPVVDEFAGTLAATSGDGRSAGPWVLVPVPGRPGTYTTRETLPAGHWKITVDCAFPSLGHGERELDVEAAAITDPAPAMTGPAPAGPTVPPTTPPTVPPTVSPVVSSADATASVSVEAARAAAPAPPESTDDTTTWAAIGTAAAAVVLVAVGYRMRVRATRR